MLQWRDAPTDMPSRSLCALARHPSFAREDDTQMGAVIFVTFTAPARGFFCSREAKPMNLPRRPGVDSLPRLCFRPGP